MIKILHIIPSDKFDKDFINFINLNFNDKENFFLLTTSKSEDCKKRKLGENVRVHKYIRSKIRLIDYLLAPIEILRVYIIFTYFAVRSNKIIFHNVEKVRLLYLYLFRFLLKKSYWGIWGISDNETPYETKGIFINIEKYVKANFKGYVTQVKGDYEIIKNVFGAKGKYYDCFMYPSNLYKEIKLDFNKKNNNELYIQIGNSGQECNNHFQIFEKLKKYRDENIRLYCILSYGALPGYKEKVIKRGKEIFGDKFVPVVDFMKFEEYMKFLSNIDIAIFAHNMQKAVGNITSLLSMKKTIYMKETVTTYGMLQDLGIVVKSFNNFGDLKKLDEIILEKNKEIIKERFSEKRLIEDLSNLFND